LFVGLGFASNIDPAQWRREPLNLVAVVDKSGSMDGEPLALVRASLLQILGQMRDGDRMSIVLYGDNSEVYLRPADVAGHRDAIEAAIRGIASEGSTNMEEGLEIGYETAFADAPGFKGNTRLMLFTDEQPNVGETSAESFIGMAQAASKRGIGLTTIGVGVQFDAKLAARVSSTRGGNLFFISDAKSVSTVFERQLDTMVSELAHDLEFTLRAARGYRIAGVFGVPDDIMTKTPEGATTVRLPTVFLSANGGGIFVSIASTSARANLPAARLAPDRPLLTAAASWKEARTGRPGNDRLAVLPATAAPSTALRTAHLLVDEYLSMREATTAFHRRADPKAAFAALTGFSARLKASGLPGLEKEEALTGQMLAQAALYSGYGGEAPKSARHFAIVGRWEVLDASAFARLKRGDRVEFTPDDEFLVFAKGTGFDDPDTDAYTVEDDVLDFGGYDQRWRYTLDGERLALDPIGKTPPSRVRLKRID
jgi:Ca-activated chloride channel family protein